MSARALSRLIISAAVIAPEIDLKCCKRSELPLYVQEKAGDEAQQQKSAAHDKPSVIEKTIRSIRLNIDGAVKEVRKYEDMGKGYVQEGVDNAQWLVDYLGDEENQAPKAPAIAIGGLTGFIFGLRGGFIKKVIYTSVGALGMAAVCYPKEAREYGGLAVEEGHKYATIAYNFAYGVKKGDKPLELPSIPKMPGSVSEVYTVLADFVSTTTASITDKQQVDTIGKVDPEPKQVGEIDPCKWVEEHKRANVGSSRFREMATTTDSNDTSEAEEFGYKGNHEDDDSCPCHLGSCMHSTNKDDCPDALPYPPPNRPDPPPKCQIK